MKQIYKLSNREWYIQLNYLYDKYLFLMQPIYLFADYLKK